MPSMPKYLESVCPTDKWCHVVGIVIDRWNWVKKAATGDDL